MSTRLPRPWFFAVAVPFAVIAMRLGGTAHGQNPRLRYPVPEHATLSPYLDLLRVDSGVLPPYHAFVQPRRAVQQQLSQQRQAIYGLQTAMSDAPRAAPGPHSDRPTGRVGGFQNYLHYYDFRPQRP